MEQLEAQCKEASEFPQNVVTKANQWRVKVHIDFLRENERKLFQKEARAALDFLDFDDPTRSQVFWPTTTHNLREVEGRIGLLKSPVRKDPYCRYVFIHAPNSRDKLRTTKDMLMLVFTYHRVMPEFLDFLPAFGAQGHARNFNFSAFYQTRYIRDMDKQAGMPELGWSGRGFRLCYNIKAVEPSPTQEHWPWSARQTAVHHAFDVETGRATWIAIKGDESMKKRIKAATDPKYGNNDMSSFASLEDAFNCTLATHNLFIQWSTESLRPYISFLENQAQLLTRPTLLEKIEKTVLSNMTNNHSLRTTPESMRERYLRNKRRFTDMTSSTTTAPQTPQRPGSTGYVMQNLDPEDGPQTDLEQGFSFSHLQEIQTLEERVNESVLILTNNAIILAEIRDFYQTLQDTQGWPVKLRTNCETSVLKLKESIEAVLSEYRRHEVRLAALLRLLADRKRLLYGILEHKNMEASTRLTEEAYVLTKEAHISAGNMEAMTQGMTSIAQKTNRETIYMRIITFVTLIFLPGTFVSVGRSTLMSTPVVHFDPNNPNSYSGFVQSGPLCIYVALSLPLVVVTLLAFWIFYWWERRKERKELKRHEQHGQESGPDKA